MDDPVGTVTDDRTRGAMGCQTYEVDKLLKQSQREVAWSQRQRLTISKKNSGTEKRRLLTFTKAQH
ncbi:putative RIMS-binding protein 2-like [Scophthalmus maximus]|uniref:Putative RIMS-binding protein 2-like n=1 Tax=Scophthalmus maximus TaxID=52904 RepID=A0A2U9BR73_SCOMX|nr:putative RIMS-binding protein 2-like [Scophthalmus maximus]